MFARDDGDMVWHALAPGWRADVGLAWNMTGRGVQGIGPAIRVGGRPLTWEDGRAPGTAIEVFPELWARWVGHPGISLGVHAGMGVRPCCGEKPAGGALEGIFLAEAGWALPPGPSPAAMTATLTPEERLRRQRRNTAIGIAAGGLVVAGGVAAAFGLHDSLGHMDVSWSAY